MSQHTASSLTPDSTFPGSSVEVNQKYNRFHSAALSLSNDIDGLPPTFDSLPDLEAVRRVCGTGTMEIIDSGDLQTAAESFQKTVTSIDEESYIEPSLGDAIRQTFDDVYEKITDKRHQILITLKGFVGAWQKGVHPTDLPDMCWHPWQELGGDEDSFYQIFMRQCVDPFRGVQDPEAKNLLFCNILEAFSQKEARCFEEEGEAVSPGSTPQRTIVWQHYLDHPTVRRWLGLASIDNGNNIATMMDGLELKDPDGRDPKDSDSLELKDADGDQDMGGL